MSYPGFKVEDKYDFLDWAATQPEWKVLGERFNKILAAIQEGEE